MGKVELPDQDVRAVIIKIFQEARANTLKKMEAQNVRNQIGTGREQNRNFRTETYHNPHRRLTGQFKQHTEDYK